MKTLNYKKQEIDLVTGEIVTKEVEITLPKVKTAFTAQFQKSQGVVHNEISLFVPNQALELGEILSRSARGMSIPIVTRQGVYISNSIDDEIDVLDKMDKDLTDYTKALLKYRYEQEQRHKKAQETQRKKDELYQEWVKTLNIQKDNTTQNVE